MLVFPPMLEQLCDLLECTDLFLASVLSQPFNTLFDISTELPAFVTDQCQPYVYVDAQTGQESKGYNRYQKYRSAWSFRRYEDLRLGRLENHPTARSMFRLPPDLVAIPAVRKTDLVEATASWLPSGSMASLVAKGKIGEEQIMAALKQMSLFRAKIKQAKPSARQPMQQQLQHTFSHPHPLALDSSDAATADWSCDACGVDASPDEITRFRCAECGIDVHRHCAARSPALLSQLPSEVVQSLRSEFGPPPLGSAAAAAPVPDERYLCLFIGKNFDQILKMIKRHRYLATTFQKEYEEKRTPQLKMEIEARCDAMVTQRYNRLASQLSPPEHLYRECTKRVRTLLMEMDFSEIDADATEESDAGTGAGAPANASAAVQRSFRRRQRQIAAVRSHLERVLRLVDSRGQPVSGTTPQIALHRLLVSAAPLLIDVISDRILFVTSPKVVRDAEQKRQAQIAESGEQPQEPEELSESDEEEAKSSRVRRPVKPSVAPNNSSRSASSLVLEQEDGEAVASSEDLAEDEPCPYTEATVRAHMHQLSAIMTPTGPSDTGALLFFTMVRQLQSHIWKAFCSLNPQVDEAAPPSLIEWLSSQSIALQASVEQWAHKRAGGKASASGSSEAAATQLKPLYPVSELCHFLLSCVEAMEGTAAWKQWEDAAAASLPSGLSLRHPAGPQIELVLSTPAAQQRLNRAVQMHFAVSDISQLGHGTLVEILQSDAAKLSGAHNDAPVVLVPLAQLLASSPPSWSAGRISAAAASLPVPVSELVSKRDLLECTQSALSHRSALSDASSVGGLADVPSADLHRLAISALASVPMMAEMSACTQWRMAFERRLGRIEAFVRANASEIAEAVQGEGEEKNDDDGPAWMMLQLSASTMIRLDPRTSLARLAQNDASARMCALQLVSLLAASSSFQKLELDSLSAACHTMLAQRIAANGLQSSVVFVLDLLEAVPEQLRLCVCDVLLPLAAATFWQQREHGVEPLALLHAALLSKAQRDSASASHLPMLHSLGLQLPVSLWIDSFQTSIRAQSRNDPVAEITRVLQQQSLEEPQDAAMAVAGSNGFAADNLQVDVQAAPVEVEPVPISSAPAASSLAPVDLDSPCAVVASSSVAVPSRSPREVIADIRLSRGVDAEFHGRDAASLAVDAAKNQLLHNALELLSKELYQSEVHWMFETIQNAADNDYALEGTLEVPTLAFRLSPTDLLIVNNELGFREENVRGICGLGNTTKRGGAAAQAGAGEAASSAPSRSRIGHKGIGFKSVYVVTDSPQIFSAGFHFQLGIQPDDATAKQQADHNMGMIVPRLIEDADVPVIVTQLKQQYAAETVIRLPLKSTLRKDSSAKSVLESGLSPWQSLRQQLSELFEPTLLLFLQHLRCLVLEQVTSDVSASVSSSRAPVPSVLELRRMAHSASSSDIVEIVESHRGFGVGDGAGTRETHRFLVVTRTVEIPQAKRVAYRWEEAPPTTQVSFAFPLSTSAEYPLPIQPVFSFLPVRGYGFRFLIQADFLLASSRDSLVESAPRNLWLMEQLPHMMPLVLQHWQRHLQLRTPGVNLLTFFHSLPLSGSRGEGDFGCMRGAAAAILQAVKGLACAQDNSGRWAQPRTLFFTSHAIVRTLLPSAMLQQSALHRSWLHPSLDPLPLQIKVAVGMQEFSAAQVIELLRKACNAFKQNEDKATTAGAATTGETAGSAQHRAFIARALQALRILLPSAADRDAELEKLRSLPVFALDNGTFVPMVADRPILMRSIADVTGSVGSEAQSTMRESPLRLCRSALERSLQIVHADLLVDSALGQSESTRPGAPLLPDHHQLVRKLLIELGVGTVDDHSLFQQAAAKLKQLSSQPEATWQTDAAREHARATIILFFHHIGSCTHPGCQVQRKQIASFALVETASGSLQRIDHIRSKLLISQPWTHSKVAQLVDRLRQTLPAELAFETLSGCYLDDSSAASSASSAPAAIDPANPGRPDWLAFWRREFGLLELFQVSVSSEVMSVERLRKDPRSQQTEAIYQMSDREPEINLQDFHSPALQRLFEVCSALPITSPLLPLAQHTLDELLSSLCDQWPAWKPFMSLRLRRNVTDFDLAGRERDVVVNHPSALMNLLRERAWIPSLRYRIASVPGAPRSIPPFMKPCDLYLADRHNVALLPIDSPFFIFTGSADHRACLEAIGIELQVSALQIYHLLVSDWSVRPGGMVSSLHRMRDVYLFLRSHGSESVDYESESSRSWKTRTAFAMRLPESAMMAGGQRISDMFSESESRPVVWLPLPHPDVAFHDTAPPVLGAFFSPHQCVLMDSNPEILNHVAYSTQWYQLPKPLPMFVTKQLYKDKDGKRSLWAGAHKKPYMEPLTKALIAYVDACVPTEGPSRLSRDSDLSELGVPRCEPLLVKHCCSWRVYLSKILSSDYANNEEMRAERDNVQVALRSGRMFPCSRLGDDSGIVHFVSLSQQPILVDDVEMAKRFAVAGGSVSGDKPLYLLLFAGSGATDEWSLDAMPHEASQSVLWNEYGLRKLSQLSERKSIIDVESTLAPALQHQLRLITRSLQRFLFSNMPFAYRSLSSELLPLLAGYRVDVCRHLEVEWEVCGTCSPAQHCAVLHEPAERRICVHQRDLLMQEGRVLHDVLAVVCSLVCDAVPVSQRTPQMQSMLVEFADALLACGRDGNQLEQQTSLRCQGAKLPGGTEAWTWMGKDEAAGATTRAREDNADAQVTRRVKGEQYSTRDLFGADASLPAAPALHDSSQPAAGPRAAPPAFSAAAAPSAPVVTPPHVAAARSMAPSLPPRADAEGQVRSSAPDRDPNAPTQFDRPHTAGGAGVASSSASLSSSDRAPSLGSGHSNPNPEFDVTAAHGFPAAASMVTAPLPPPASVPDAVVQLLSTARSQADAASSEAATSLVTQMAECVRRFPAPSSSGPVESGVDSQLSRDVGWFGEALCYQILLHREAERMLAAPSSAPRAVIWLNRDGESGLPYDLQYGDNVSDPSTELIEVKSTLHGDRQAFDISAREVSIALQYQHRYSIWRCTHVGDERIAKLQILNNPAAAWHQKQVKVTMII